MMLTSDECGRSAGNNRSDRRDGDRPPARNTDPEVITAESKLG